jgi:hypothetical protein
MKAMFPALLFGLLFSVSAFSQQAQLFDNFETINCDDYLGRISNVMVAARNNPSMTVYVLIYEGRVRFYDQEDKTESGLPVFGEADAKIRSMKKYLSIKKFPARRFLFIKGGFREYEAVEFWTVPNGAAPPKPTPTVAKMKYRKGKTYGLCTSCCGP